MTKRFWEIDFLRGIAIISMILFHALFSLNYFDLYSININSGILAIFANLTRITFLVLVGVSLTLSFSRVEEKITSRKLKTKFVLRGLKIFGLGMLITLFTWYFLDRGFVVFGILHCIGISIILAYPFIKLRFPNLIVGVALSIVGILLKILTFDFYWLVWLGFKPIGFYTIDYFPILPWFGVVLIGIFLGNSLYPKHKRDFYLEDLSNLKPVRFFCYLGRYSLAIYFLHQILIISIIYLFKTLYL